jgi:cytochrome c oxidase subunit 1
VDEVDEAGTERNTADGPKTAPEGTPEAGPETTPEAGSRAMPGAGSEGTARGDAGPTPTPRATWIDWLTTTDHKRIGTLYLVTAFAFFVVGGVMALLMRAELARPG